MKYLILTLIIWFLAISFPAEASTCYNYHGQSICILSIKRSAKYPWEYRAAVSIQDVIRPIEVYDCRQQVRIKKDRTVVPFQNNGAGELICSILNKR